MHVKCPERSESAAWQGLTPKEIKPQSREKKRIKLVRVFKLKN